MEKLLEVLLGTTKDWRSKKGLLAGALITFIGYILIITGLKQVIIIPSKLILILPLVALELIWLVIWLFKSYRLPIFSKRINLAFSLKSEGDTSAIVQEVEKEMRREMQLLSVTESLKIIELPTDVKFEAYREAEKYITKKDIDLLIWGDTKSGSSEGKSIIELKLKFTYNYKIPISEGLKNLLSREVHISMMNRKWAIVREQSFKELDIIAMNILQVSLYILTICLTLRNNFDMAIEICEKLQANVRTLDNMAKKIFGVFIERTLQLLEELYRIKAEAYRWRNNSNIEKLYLDKMLDINYNSYPAHISIARWYYKNGQEQKAREHNNTAEKLQPKNPLSKLNYAFFSLVDRKFEKAAELYTEIKKENYDSRIVLGVVEWFDEEYEKNKHNLGLLFAGGFFNFYLLDPKRGEKQLKKFMKLAEKARLGTNNNEYSPLAIVAERAFKEN